MTGRFEYPDLDQKMDAIKKWLRWCTEIEVVWIDQDDGGRVRESQKVWGELRPRRIVTLGVDETRYEDVDNLAGDARYPRQDTIIGQRQLMLELRTKSRDQNHRQSAWYAATRAQLRVRYLYGKNKWLAPFDLSLATVADVVNMPEIKIKNDRIEDIANLEFTLNTFLCDKDTAAIGTWIEHVEVSSDLKNAGGTSLDPSIQLDKELM